MDPRIFNTVSRYYYSFYNASLTLTNPHHSCTWLWLILFQHHNLLHYQGSPRSKRPTVCPASPLLSIVEKTCVIILIILPVFRKCFPLFHFPQLVLEAGCTILLGISFQLDHRQCATSVWLIKYHRCPLYSSCCSKIMEGWLSLRQIGCINCGAVKDGLW